MLTFFFSNKEVNNGLASSVQFLSMERLFPARRKILEHEAQSSALDNVFLSAGNNPRVL